MKNLRNSCLLLLICVGFFLPVTVAAAESESEPATIAVLSRTDFLPDATKVYGRRASNAHEKRGDRINRSHVDSDEGFEGYGKDVAETTMVHDGMVEADSREPAWDDINLPLARREVVGLPEFIADAILEQLAASGRFRPVERKALRTIALEQRFGEKMDKFYAAMRTEQAGDDVSFAEKKFYTLLRDFQDLGKAAGARWIVVGNLQQLGASAKVTELPYGSRKVTTKSRRARLKLRVVDTLSGTVVGADSININTPAELVADDPGDNRNFPFVDTIGRKAAARVLDIIYPARLIKEQPLIISRGSSDGIRVGTFVSLVREGEELKEADGTTITRFKTPVGKARVISTQQRIATVEAIDGTPRKGDLVVFATEDPAAAAAGETAELSPLPKKEPAAPTLAVVGIAFSTPNASCLGKKEVVNRLTDNLVVSLARSGRFNLYERKDIDRPIDEKTFEAITGGTGMRALLNEFVGTDWLFVGQIERFGTISTAKEVPYLDEVETSREGIAEGLFKIVDSHSGQIIAAERVRLARKYRNEKRLQAETRLLDDFSDNAADAVLKRLFPLKVLGLGADNTVFLNRGEDGDVRRKQLYEVKRAGAPLTDPDTGIAMGSTETTIGLLEVVAVEPARARGVMVEGEMPKKGDLLIRKKSAAPTRPEKMKVVW